MQMNESLPERSAAYRYTCSHCHMTVIAFIGYGRGDVWAAMRNHTIRDKCRGGAFAGSWFNCRNFQGKKIA
jgi:hypothetical protein